MEVYRTKDGTVSKYIHDDGSETAIKTNSSCDNVIDPEGKVTPVNVDRNKYSVFVSSSVGCPIGCKFCYLTKKKFPYIKLTPNQIITNVKEAVKAEVTKYPELRKKYIKLSWMGMGDALLLPPHDVVNISETILKWAIGDKGYAWGLDGVDIGTVLPKSAGWPHHFGIFNSRLLSSGYKFNPYNCGSRSPLRLFYSLHSLDSHIRKQLIPIHSQIGWHSDLNILHKFNSWYGVDVILHNLFFKDINDADETINWYSDPVFKGLLSNFEFRILRYNKCPGSEYEETDKFDEIVSKVNDVFPKVKYQVSSGSEIYAACGQFICKESLTTKE